MRIFPMQRARAAVISAGMTHALYGHPPRTLAALPAGAVQYSPLLPGAACFGATPPASLDGLTMLAPPGTVERRYAMALALRALKPGAPFTILAPRDKGGSRLARELADFGCAVAEASKQHHRICSGTRPETLAVEDAAAEGAPRYSEALGLWTQPGVFSWDRVDPGSALLVAHLPALAGRGADLGCGIGFLARAVLAAPAVTQLTLVDIDRRAIAMATKNLPAERVALHWADATALPLAGLDFVVTNPPFHTGGIEDKTLGQDFIRTAASSLRPGGRCWLVANRHLPYEAVMAPLFRQTTLVAEENGFKLYEAVK